LKKPAFLTLTPLVLCLFAASGFGQQNTLLDRIKAKYGVGTSLSASFDVRILWKVREKEDTKQGTLVVAPGDKFRVELGGSVWVSDGATLWQYDRATSQVVIKQLASVDNGMLPSHALMAYCSKYPLSPVKSTGADAVLEWKADTGATAKQTEVSLVRITASDATAEVKKLFIVDRTGNETTYSFRGTVVGKTAPQKTFTFVVPKGARVLDQR
jgi:outer membrane lipoprotein-sorting protein